MRCFELPVPFFDGHQATIGSILPAPVRIWNWTRCFLGLPRPTMQALGRYPSDQVIQVAHSVETTSASCRKEWA